MAKQRLFPEPPDSAKRSPKKRFDELATKVFSTPKSEIDKREQHWKNNRTPTASPQDQEPDSD